MSLQILEFRTVPLEYLFFVQFRDWHVDVLDEEELSVYPQSGEDRIKGSFFTRHVTVLALHLPGIVGS